MTPNPVDPYFILITLNLQDWTKLDVEAFRKVLELGQGWVRAVGFSWLVKTTSPPDLWYRRLEPLLPDDSELFIVKVDLTERQGLLPKVSWDWINSQVPAQSPLGLFGAFATAFPETKK